MTMLEIALSYLDKGFSVIPIWSPVMVERRPTKKYQEDLKEKLEKNNRLENPEPDEFVEKKHFTNQCKLPLLFSWDEYKKRRPTREEVMKWFTEYPDANIAIITGAVSGIIVMDLDSPGAANYALSRGWFPSTPMVETGRGSQVYLKRPDFTVGNSADRDLKIDMRGDGGYVVAPPSMHGSGRQYRWMDDCNILDVDLAECPDWVLDFIKNPPKNQSKATPQVAAVQANTNAPGQKVEGNKFVDILRNGTSAGDRNQTAASFIGHYIKLLKDPDEVWEITKLWNQKNSPPLDQQELRKTFDSVRSMDVKGKINMKSFLYDVNKVVAEYEEQYVRVPFGCENLRNLEIQMNGGLAGGRLYIFGGIPSAGKTVLLNNMADNICKNGYPIIFYSYDDGTEELLFRTFARFSNYDINAFNIRAATDVKQICNSADVKKIIEMKYVVKQQIHVEKWDEMIEELKKTHDRPPVIIIDYLRKLKTDSKGNDERLRIDDMLFKLTELAKKHNSPIVAISELARDSYKSGQRLSIASFKETGMIEYEASWLGILAAVEEDESGGYKIKDNWEKLIEQDGKIDIIVFKAKRGTGFTGNIHLKLDKEKMTVMDRVDDKKQTTKTQKKTKY